MYAGHTVYGTVYATRCEYCGNVNACNGNYECNICKRKMCSRLTERYIKTPNDHQITTCVDCVERSLQYIIKRKCDVCLNEREAFQFTMDLGESNEASDEASNEVSKPLKRNICLQCVFDAALHIHTRNNFYKK